MRWKRGETGASRVWIWVIYVRSFWSDMKERIMLVTAQSRKNLHKDVYCCSEAIRVAEFNQRQYSRRMVFTEQF